MKNLFIGSLLAMHLLAVSGLQAQDEAAPAASEVKQGEGDEGTKFDDAEGPGEGEGEEEEEEGEEAAADKMGDDEE